MTLTTTIDTPKARIDWTKPVLWLFAAVMIVLIVLPLSWLAVYAFTDKARHPTLQNFVTLFTNPDFLDPLLTTAIIATTLGRDLLHRRRTDRLAGVAHRHAGTADHPRAGDGLVRDAAVSRRGRLGIAGGAEQRAAEPALSLAHRRRSGRASVQHLFADRASSS